MESQFCSYTLLMIPLYILVLRPLIGYVMFVVNKNKNYIILHTNNTPHQIGNSTNSENYLNFTILLSIHHNLDQSQMEQTIFENICFSLQRK